MVYSIQTYNCGIALNDIAELLEMSQHQCEETYQAQHMMRAKLSYLMSEDESKLRDFIDFINEFILTKRRHYE